MNKTDFSGQVNLSDIVQANVFLTQFHEEHINYIVTGVEMVKLFEDMLAWKVSKIVQPVTMREGKLESGDNLGNYGLYLTVDGYLLSKPLPPIVGDPDVLSDYYKSEHQKLSLS
jgi:hypothetical protein